MMTGNDDYYYDAVRQQQVLMVVKACSASTFSNEWMMVVREDLWKKKNQVDIHDDDAHDALPVSKYR
jgi:hypothetical protein